MKKELLVATAVTFLSLSMQGMAEKPLTPTPPEKIKINHATIQELDESLEGVGRRVAQEIVKHRKTYGPFRSMEDLDKVKFVGQKLLEKNKKRISFD